MFCVLYRPLNYTQAWRKTSVCMPTHKYACGMNQECVRRPAWGKAEGERTQAAEHKELAMCPSPHIW